MANSNAIDGLGTESKSLLASMTCGWTRGACITLESGFTFCRNVCQSIKACIGGGCKSRRLTTSRMEENNNVEGSRRDPRSVSAAASSSLDDLFAPGSWNYSNVRFWKLGAPLRMRRQTIAGIEPLQTSQSISFYELC